MGVSNGKKKPFFINIFINFQNIENQLDKKIKAMQTNGGGKFIDSRFNLLLIKEGISHRSIFLPIYTTTD